MFSCFSVVFVSVVFVVFSCVVAAFPVVEMLTLFVPTLTFAIVKLSIGLLTFSTPKSMLSSFMSVFFSLVVDFATKLNSKISAFSVNPVASNSSLLVPS